MIDTTIFQEGSNDSNSTNYCNNIIDTATGKIDILKYCIEYTRRLEEKGKFQLCIWPEHCLMGSVGHTMVEKVLDAIHTWTEQTGRNVEYIYKGQNLYTEMYSALTAEVPISNDTTFNQVLQNSMELSDRLYIAGQALSHCVNYTTRDIVQHWPKERSNHVHILVDCTSAVSGFENAAQQFLSDMRDAGVQITTSTDVVVP
jgi:nicotinamidase-related amidase